MIDPAYWRTPLDLDRWPIPRGQVHVLGERCKGCDLCIDYCPVSMLGYSRAYNARGYRYPVVKPGREQACVYCRYCQVVCPDFAIWVTPSTGEEP